MMEPVNAQGFDQLLKSYLISNASEQRATIVRNPGSLLKYYMHIFYNERQVVTLFYVVYISKEKQCCEIGKQNWIMSQRLSNNRFEHGQTHATPALV